MKRLFLCISFSLCASCSGGGSNSVSSGFDGANFGCDGTCPREQLTEADVGAILSQAAGAASANGVAGTFAVLDRVGNVLAVYQMPGALPASRIDGQIGAVGGLEGVSVPATLAAISKAGTGAYLSSQGNAFSTRTASQIIQENFDPGETNRGGGPLFGVQFSQLLCSDLMVRNSDVAAPLPAGRKPSAGGWVGPRALPLGLSADPGGIPLYKQGDLVGGIGVEIDGLYMLDRNVRDRDDAIEERVALAASRGFEAPSERVASAIFVGGKSLRFTDLRYRDIPEYPAAEIDGSLLLAIPEFSSARIKSGARYGSAESGILETFRAGVPSASLVYADGSSRYSTRKGSALPGGVELQAEEVDALLDSALITGVRARAAIRRPLDTIAQVSIFVVDTEGEILGFTSTPDAPVFGIDIALQKARSAAFMSSPDAPAKLEQARVRNGVGAFDDWGPRFAAFVGEAGVGAAYGARSIGNLARPFFVDGINGNPPGPLSLPFPGTAAGRTWSPFNTGLQLDLIFERLVAPLGVPAAPSSLPDSCTDRSVFGSRLASGLQIFPGGVPLYKNGVLVGGIGVSGDGIDQDDLVSFYGASVKGLRLVGREGIGDAALGFNAPSQIRADRLALPDPEAQLRYVACPEAAFLDTEDQNVCGGL